jgi:ABC-type amino acid transport substrate-binding protein
MPALSAPNSNAAVGDSVSGMTSGPVLRVGSAFPDPPFEVDGEPASGFDVALLQEIARELGREWELHRYTGADFDGIFGGLGSQYDVVASGATATDHRRTLACWCDPYLRSGQSLVVDHERTPDVHGTDDLARLVLGVQHGNTSQPVARQLHADGKVSDVKVYPYDAIEAALGDLESGAIGAFMKLEPVMRWLTATRPRLEVVATGITTEYLAIAVGRRDDELAQQINAAQRAVAGRGEGARLAKQWLADSDPSATTVLL